MIYPKLPYQGSRVDKKLVEFRGINYTENYKEGEFADTKGISSEKYPVMMPRKGREIQATYSDVKDLFEWDGKMLVVEGTMLYFDNVPICNVNTEPKQFAVVNTHLLIFPDLIDIDTTSEYHDDQDVRHFKYDYLNAQMKNTYSQFSNGTDVKGVSSGFVKSFQDDNCWSYDDGPASWSARERPVFYTYGTDEAAVKACWKTDHWDVTALQQLEHIRWWDNGHGTDNAIKTGEILIPQIVNSQFALVYGTGWYTRNTNPQPTDGIISYPDRTKYNTSGHYMKTSLVGFGVERKSSSYEPYYTLYYQISYPTFDVYAVGSQLWSEKYTVGDLISCSGATGYEFTDAKITAINDSTNTITVKAKDDDGEYTANAFSTTQATITSLVTFTKSFPSLDYVCEKGNRLWGVSNKDKTIYASALGLPSRMYDYSGVDTDSYAVAVGSEGDFTGIANYGDAVVCFKENTIHKILGDYPSNFYMSQYKVDGIQKGSHKSLCNINEVLYYKGVNGIYAYTGSAPSLISSALGRDIYHAAVGGTDGQRYYISMHDASENSLLFVYDLHNGIWIKEDDIYVDSFTKLSGVAVDDQVMDQFYFCSDGTLYRANVDNTEQFEWYAEFKPFLTYRTSSSSYSRSFGKQGLTKLSLVLDMEKGSRVTIRIKEDDGKWKLATTIVATRKKIELIPIRLGRCEYVHIRLEGKGKAVFRGLERSYNVGSEV